METMRTTAHSNSACGTVLGKQSKQGAMLGLRNEPGPLAFMDP